MGFATNKLLACLVLVLLLVGWNELRSQEALDILYLKTGEKIEGTVIQRLPDGSIQFKFDQGTLPYPKNRIEKIVLGERPELKQAQEASAAGKSAEVITILTPVVDKFLGFKSAWVGEAASELANALAQTGQTFKAVELAKRISQEYPGSSIGALGAILEANTLLLQNKTDEALAKLNSVKDQLPVKTSPNASEMQLLGGYHMAMGNVMQKRNKPTEALKHFLTVVAVYPHSLEMVNAAQQKADALTESNPDLIVP